MWYVEGKINPFIQVEGKVEDEQEEGNFFMKKMLKNLLHEL